MAIFKCEYCGKEFQAKPSAHRKYCSKDCSNAAKRGKKLESRVEKVKVVCKVCGKEEYVNPCRAKNYHCCSVECLAKYNSERYSKKIVCTCPVCGKEFYLKPYTYSRVKTTPCCSKECAAKLKEITYQGENNPQYGLKGNLNASFKNENLIKKNHNIDDIFVYAPEYLDSNKDGRITLHRLTILQNYKNFDPCFFLGEENKIRFNNDVHVHHIDGNHSNNNINNLIPLTKRQHRAVHNILLQEAEKTIHKIIGVIKQGELLETPEVDNQQPSLASNSFEGSETNNRVQTVEAGDSNIDTSALLNNINSIINDYIVQTKNITLECYEHSIQEILESEIKSSELNTNGLSK